MEKIECNIIYSDGKDNKTEAKFSFTLTSTTALIEDPKTGNAAVVISGTPFQTNLNYKALKEKQSKM